MTLHPILADARNPDGTRRFYPPGKHPATHRYRRQLALLLTTEPSRERQALVDHVQDALATFEEGESYAKAVYLQGKRGHA